MRYHEKRFVNRLGVTWLEMRRVSSASASVSQTSRSVAPRSHGNLRYPYDPEALGLHHL